MFLPTARAVGLAIARPYDLRHSYASLRLHEGALSIVELAEQMGHNPTVCLGTYAHVMAELRGAPRTSAEEQIRAARGRPAEQCGPNVAQGRLFELPEWPDSAVESQALCRTRTGDPFLTMEVLYQLS